MGKGKRYSREFQLQACKLVVEQGCSLREAAERIGTTAWSLRQWIKKHRADGALPPSEATEDTAAELKQLRKEHKRLQLEVEILKKATAYFAREQL